MNVGKKKEENTGVYNVTSKNQHAASTVRQGAQIKR